MAEAKPDVRREIAGIMEGVLNGLLSIPFPDQFTTPDGNPEYISSHWCEKCKKYHRVYSS
jgi:hypothetical protein